MKAPSTPLISVALIAYVAVMVALTMFKAFFVIGLLWQPEAQRTSGYSFQPFNDFIEAGWFAPLFGYGGNFAFFVPFGVLLYVLLHKKGRSRGAIFTVTLLGAVLSVGVEISQYLFRLGFSDIDDLIFNTLGACVGAVIAKLLGPRFHMVWVWLSIALAVIFAVLVALGPRLGDPDKVVDVQALSFNELIK